MSENKTKDSVLRANANFRKNHTQSKTVQFHKIKDGDILRAIKKSKTPFATTVKQLLRKHYNLNEKNQND